MSQSPATPNKPSGGAGKTAVSSTEKPALESWVMHTSLHEPSPASTYGETTAGDSIPATPQDADGHVPQLHITALPLSCLLHALLQSQRRVSDLGKDQTAALLDSLRAASLNDSVDRGSGSPFPARVAKSFGRAEQRSIIRRDPGPQSDLSPSNKRSNKDTSVSPVKQDRHEPNIENPSWRKHGDFIRSSQGEDPFMISHNQATRLASTGGIEGGFRPREDRASLPLSADTAQAMLPPSACVFVANLLQSKSDDQLEHSVLEAFQGFGNVYVKIRRDNKGMPFAFCQYENANDAQRAITMGRGLVIDGRPCRTEVAKVNRSLYLSKITGGHIPEHEARQILARFGDVEKLWYCSQTDKEMFRLPEGVWVMFAFYQDCRDAQAGFRDDPTYRLEQPKMPEDVRTRLGGNSNGRTQAPRFSPARLNDSPQALMRRAADLASVFVGNLPPNATEDRVREVFGLYGRIVQIEIVRKPSVNGEYARDLFRIPISRYEAAGVNTFAFVQFRSSAEAEYASSLCFNLGGHRLRVERKEPAESLARHDTMLSGGSPRNRFPMASQDTMTMLFQHGVSVGMANASASQSPPGASSMFTPYNTYGFAGVPQFAPLTSQGRLLESEAAQGLQAHAQACVPQTLQHGVNPTLSQFQVPTIAPAQTAHYLPASNWPQRTNNYQWPPADPTIPTITREEIS
ncbi:MAG: hypothetical protein Q9196_001832 [Gyalolechia fulgens]